MLKIKGEKTGPCAKNRYDIDHVKQRTRKDNKLTRQREAEERNKIWATLSYNEQLQHLDTNNFRALKQRSKIASSNHD